MQVQPVQSNQSFNGNIIILGKYGRNSLEHMVKGMRNLDFVKEAKCDVYIRDFRNQIMGKKENWIGVVATRNVEPEKIPLGLWKESKTKNKQKILETIKSAIQNPISIDSKASPMETLMAMESAIRKQETLGSTVKRGKKPLITTLGDSPEDEVLVRLLKYWQKTGDFRPAKIDFHKDGTSKIELLGKEDKPNILSRIINKVVNIFKRK